MTPSERAALKADVLELVADALSKNLDITQSNLLKKATQLRRKARAALDPPSRRWRHGDEAGG